MIPLNVGKLVVTGKQISAGQATRLAHSEALPFRRGAPESQIFDLRQPTFG
jgi:hypothetical protein